MFAADQERWSAQSSARTSPIERFIWHHQAGTNDDGTIGMMVSGSKNLSANWTVDNRPPVGAGLRDYARITAVVPEDRRPWTSASRADDGALTAECANSSGPPDYGISEASHRACARLAAYALRAYGVPLQRATAANGWRGHMGHNEVVGAFGDGYATACPLHLDIDRIIALASGEGGIDNVLGDDVTPEQDIALRTARDNSDMALGRIIALQVENRDEIRPGIAFVQSQVGALGALVAELIAREPGQAMTAEQIEGIVRAAAREAVTVKVSVDQ